MPIGLPFLAGQMAGTGGCLKFLTLVGAFAFELRVLMGTRWRSPSSTSAL